MHTIREKQKLLDRIRRIRGQTEAIERLLENEGDCSRILQIIAACRGAINGLMAKVIEGHIREHVLDPRRKPTAGQMEATEELLEVLKTYLK